MKKLLFFFSFSYLILFNSVKSNNGNYIGDMWYVKNNCVFSTSEWDQYFIYELNVEYSDYMLLKDNITDIQSCNYTLESCFQFPYEFFFDDINNKIIVKIRRYPEFNLIEQFDYVKLFEAYQKNTHILISTKSKKYLFPNRVNDTFIYAVYFKGLIITKPYNPFKANVLKNYISH